MTKSRESANEAIKQIEAGVLNAFESENYQNYLRTMAKFHKYSAGNQILIWTQKPDATRVAAFGTWKKMGRYVKGGEKGIRIIAPSFVNVDKLVTHADGTQEVVKVKIPFYKPVYVFDVSQTEGEELPTIARMANYDIDNYESLIQIIKKVAEIPVTFEDIVGTARGYYSPSENKIVLKAGMAQSETVSVLIHELGHSVMHKNDSGKTRNSEEVEAESVAFVVSNYLGLDTGTSSFEYIANWSTGKEVKELKASLDVISKTSQEIIDKIEKEFGNEV